LTKIVFYLTLPSQKAIKHANIPIIKYFASNTSLLLGIKKENKDAYKTEEPKNMLILKPYG